MKVKAAVVKAPGQAWEIEEVELGDPVSGEVQVRLAASGLCHSDEHLRTGASPLPFYPALGGHEGAGVVTKVGPGVASVEEGDHVVLAFIPACGRCPSCAKGLQNICDEGAGLLTGQAISDKTYRVTLDDEPVIQMCLLGTFSPYVTVNEASVIKNREGHPARQSGLARLRCCHRLGIGHRDRWSQGRRHGGGRRRRRRRNQLGAGCGVRRSTICDRDRSRRVQARQGKGIRAPHTLLPPSRKRYR